MQVLQILCKTTYQSTYKCLVTTSRRPVGDHGASQWFRASDGRKEIDLGKNRENLKMLTKALSHICFCSIPLFIQKEILKSNSFTGSTTPSSFEKSRGKKTPMPMPHQNYNKRKEPQDITS